MLIPFIEMPKSSRVWIYQADRELTSEEVDFAIIESEAFCEQWVAHGHQLNSSFKLAHNKFLILAVDESSELPSGCSIDSSVHLVKHLESKLGVDFLDRTKVNFIVDGDVFAEPLNNLKTRIQEGVITQDTLTFNNLVADIETWESSWTIPARETWLKKYFG